MRIVSLVPTATELVFALGEGHKIVGVSDHCDWPESPLEAIPRVGAFLDGDVDVITDLRPDLALVDGTLQGAIIRVLRDRGIETVDVSCPSPENWSSVILRLGVGLGCEARAEEMARWGSDLFQAWRIWSDSVREGRPRVARILAALPDGRAVVAGGDTVQGRILELAGLHNAFAEVEGYGVVSFDSEIERNIDYLLLCETPQASSLLEDGSLEGVWTDLRVVREERFLFVPCNLMCRYSQRMKECLEKLAVSFRDDFPRISDWE